MSKRKILVTGGMGYIGSHTVVELLADNYEVIIADNLSNSNTGALDGIKKITGITPEFIQIDFRDFKQTQKIFDNHPDINGIIHFAAFKAVGESIAEPMKYYENNIFSTINLLKAIAEKNINLIFSSSCTVYGEPDYLPVDEKHKFNPPTSPYGYTKQLSEQIIKDAVRISQGKLKAISLRYFNPIGAHESGFIGESPKKTYNLIPLLTQTAVGKRKELYVFGCDYPTPDGSPVRDYCHVSDLAEAHVIALNRLFNNKNKKNYEFFNIGVGKGFTVLEIIKTFEKVSGKKINYKCTDRREGDTAEIFASTELANKELGWKAKRNLEDMLKSAWLWESKYKFY